MVGNKNALRYPSGKTFFILFALYYLLNYMFPLDITNIAASEGRIYPQLAMGAIFAYSLFYVGGHINSIRKESLFNVFLLFLILTSLYIPFTNGNRTILDNFIQFVKINSAGIITIGIYLTLKNSFKEIKWIYLIFAMQVIYGFYTLIVDYFSVMILQVVDNPGELFDSNSGFILATLIPMSLLLPLRWLRTLVYFLLVLSCLISGQRTAALVALGTLPFSYKYFRGSISGKKLFLIIFFAIIFAFPLIEAAIDNFIIRQEYEEAHDSIGSGRFEFWAISIDSYLNGNILNIIVGYGYFAINALLDKKYGVAISAHNGFIEHIYAFGLIGFFIYLSIYYNIYRLYIRLKKLKDEKNNVILVMLISIIIRSMLSHGNLDISFIPFFMPIAIILALKKNNKIKII